MNDAEHPLPPRIESIAAVILAAGAGSRFASEDHKLLTDVQGKPVVAHVIAAAREADVAEVIVVQGAVDLSHLVPDDVTLLANEQWADGQATSLRAAVSYAQMRGHDVIVVGLGDSPGVTTEVWDQVAHVDADLASARYGRDLRPPVRDA